MTITIPPPQQSPPQPDYEIYLILGGITLLTAVLALVFAWLLHRLAYRSALPVRSIFAGFAPVGCYVVLIFVLLMVGDGMSFTDAAFGFLNLPLRGYLTFSSWLLLGWLVALVTGRFLRRRSRRVAGLDPGTFS